MLISVLALIIFSLLMLLCTLAVLFDAGRPVFFRQDRLGLKGKVFSMYKFRSMVHNAEHTGSGVYSEAGDERKANERGHEGECAARLALLGEGACGEMCGRPAQTITSFPAALQKAVENSLALAS